MIKIRFYQLVCLICGVLLFGCEQQSPLIIHAKINTGAKTHNNVHYVFSGMPVEFNVTAKSQDSEISEVSIYGYDRLSGKQKLFDTLFVSQSDVNFNWEHSFPYYSDSTYVELSFVAIAKNAEKMEYKMPCVVVPTEQRNFTQVELVDMYSAASYNRSAFSFTLLSPIFKGTDSVCMYDIEQADSLKRDCLSRSWGASEGILFARVGDFDFSNASFRSIQTAYSYSVHYPTITDIRVGDILMVGHKEKAFGLIKVVLVVDEEGVENDRYTFSAKFFKE